MGFREGQVIFKCPKCCSIKPDRAHHCSVCQRYILIDFNFVLHLSICGVYIGYFIIVNFRCIRKMDHHCPWVNNCVGENNQKYFVLFTVSILIIFYLLLYKIIIHVLKYFYCSSFHCSYFIFSILCTLG